MKIKSLILAFAAATLAISSCVKEQKQDDGTPSITVDGQKAVELSFGSTAETKTVTIVSNREWKMKDLSDTVKTWLTVSGATGAQEATTGKVVTIGVSNNEGVARSAEVEFTIGTKSVIVSVTQKTGVAPKTLPYKESFETQGDFTIKNITLPSGFSYIWYATSYGSDKFMKASAYKSSTGYASESWLVSPEINLVGEKSAIMQCDFDQAYGTKEKYAEAFFLYIIKENEEKVKLNVENPTSGQFSSFKTQKFDMADYLGQKIKVAFVYTSEAGASGASTVEVKNFKIAAKPDSLTTTKISDLLSAEEGTPFTLTGATVAETGEYSYVLTDNTDYILVYDTVAVTVVNNDVLTVVGRTTVHADKIQIADAKATKTGTGTFVAPTPEDITSTFDKFTSDKIKYVKVMGKVEKGTSKAGDVYYNIIVPGASTNKGTIADTSKFDVASFAGKMVNVEGFYTATTGTVYINILPSKISLADYILLDSDAKTVAAKDTTVSFKVSSNITWSIETPVGCTSKGNYSGITGDSTVTYTFPVNTDTSKVNTYVFKVSDDGGILPAVEFTLNQKKAGQAAVDTVVVDFSKSEVWPSDFPTAYSKTEGTYKFGDYNYTFGYGSAGDGYKKGTGAGGSAPYYIIMGKTGAWLQMPIIEGKALSTVKILTGASASTVVEVAIQDKNGKVVSPKQTLSAQSETFTFSCTGADPATSYRIVVQNNKNCQISKLTLLYE